MGGKLIKWSACEYVCRYYLNVSNIIVNNTNLPSNGTTNEVGGMISANSRKNTVSDSRMDIDKLTWNIISKFLAWFNERFGEQGGRLCGERVSSRVIRMGKVQ